MKIARVLLIAAVVIGAILVTGAAILAQGTNGSFGDARINGDIYIGDLALYCVDQNGTPNRSSFQDGGITVWSVGGSKYIDLNAAQLRGEQATTSNTHVVGDPSEITQFPVLLATAQTDLGEIWFWLAGPNDFFQLQGTDQWGKFYTYTWQGCSLGYVANGGGPYTANVAAATVTARPTFVATRVPTAVPTVSATETIPEATPEATTSP